MTDTAPPSPPRSPLWLRLTLIGSLTLNLLVVGIVAGAVIRGPFLAGRDASEGALPLRAIHGALPEGERRALRRDLIGKRATFRGSRRELRALRADLATAVADPYDRAAVEAVFARYQAVLRRTEAVAFETVLTRLDGMDAAARAAFAERLTAPRPARKRQGEAAQ